MVYYLIYKDSANNEYELFDIEYYKISEAILMNKCASDFKELKYRLELYSSPLVRGIVMFLRYKKDDTIFDYDEFIKDATVIQELRGFLWEHHQNDFLPYKEITKYYDEFQKELEAKLEFFAGKYGLTIITD